MMTCPGLRPGLQLGNFHKYLALHYDEQLIRYLNHIGRIWRRIMGSYALSLVNTETVMNLQGLVPKAEGDKRKILSALEDGKLFSGCPVHVRQHLTNRVLQLDTIIPSLATLHENMNFFSIAVGIIKMFLGVELRRRHSMRRCIEELRDTDHIPQSNQDAFRELTSFALQNFPFLSNESPRLGHRRGGSFNAGVCQGHVGRFLRLAKDLGFPVQCPEQSNIRETTPWTGHVKTWRFGRPFVPGFLTIYKANMSSSAVSNPNGPRNDNEVNPVFVFQDLMRVWFGAHTGSDGSTTAPDATDGSKVPSENNNNQPPNPQIQLIPGGTLPSPPRTEMALRGTERRSPIPSPTRYIRRDDEGNSINMCTDMEEDDKGNPINIYTEMERNGCGSYDEGNEGYKHKDMHLRPSDLYVPVWSLGTNT